MAALSNNIYIGDIETPTFSFDNSSIAHVNGVFSVDVIGNELAVDTVTATVRYTGDGDIRGIPYGTPAWWYNDGGLVCAVFVRNVERIARYLYRLTLISGVGLLENTVHVGGVYNGTVFEDVADEIIGGAFTYTVAAEVQGLPVYGWLPYGNARENLHQLLFATGVTLKKGVDGNPVFLFLTDNNPRPVPDSRIAYGGTVDYQSPASAVEVTEHSFGAAPGTPETLFDNTESAVAAENTLAVFSGPYTTLTATGSLVIEESGVNYAVVSGIGALTGVPFSHFTRVISRVNPDAYIDNIKRVTDMYLVSLANSINVAKRVLAYFSSAKTVRSSIVLSGEKSGDILALNDPYNENMTAFLAEADVNVSSNLLANCRLVEGYTPTGQGNNFDTVDVLTGSGTWIVPEGVTEITVVLIGGGDGGTPGTAGGAAPLLSFVSQYGTRNADMNTAGPSTGGKAGTPGKAGKVYLIAMTVTPGQTISYTVGVGGAGQIYGGIAPGDGTPSVFGVASSDDGVILENGYADPISGEVYATPGADGYDGGPGVGWEQIEGVWHITDPGPLIADGNEYYPGTQGTLAFEQGINKRYYSYGGAGGGAAYGVNGGDGADGHGTLSGPNGFVEAYAPSGGNGATPAKPPKPTVYGQGGGAGHGGGGAGQNGAADVVQTFDETLYDWYTQSTNYLYNDTPATPGDGSDGGDGADGCIEIYYKAPLPVILSVNAQGHAIANNAEYLGDDTLELVPTQEANGGHLLYTEV